VSLLSHATTVARRLFIDFHDNDDNNDNAWQRGPLWPHGMGPIRRVVSSYYVGMLVGVWQS